MEPDSKKVMDFIFEESEILRSDAMREMADRMIYEEDYIVQSRMHLKKLTDGWYKLTIIVDYAIYNEERSQNDNGRKGIKSDPDKSGSDEQES